MFYCDTSLIVAALTPEAHSNAADRWLAAQPANGIAISAWVATEVASGLAMKARRCMLSDRARAQTWARWTGDIAAVAISLPIDRAHFGRAADFIDAGSRGLRASDALHLAIAAGNGIGMATLDEDLAEAAREIGLDVPTIRWTT